MPSWGKALLVSDPREVEQAQSPFPFSTICQDQKTRTLDVTAGLALKQGPGRDAAFPTGFLSNPGEPRARVSLGKLLLRRWASASRPEGTLRRTCLPGPALREVSSGTEKGGLVAMAP